MIFSLFHLLTGYCRVVLHGRNQARFVNLCAAQGILLWNLKKKENHYFFCISAKGFRELDKIAGKTGVSYRCLKKKGLPFLFARYKKRKIFLLCLALSAAGFYVLSLFIWRVETQGCYSHSEEEMLSYLKEKGIRSGTKISEVSCPELEEQIRKDFADIAWVSCERKGTVLKVSVKETLDQKNGREEENGKEGQDIRPCNLIASKKGTIDSILVRSGSAKVKKGDAVKPGDVLISGVVEILDDAGEAAEEVRVQAQGDVYAVSQISYQDVFPLVYYRKEYSGREKNFYQISAGKYRVKLPGTKPDYADYDVESTEIPLRLGDQFYLPVSVYKIRCRECTPVRKSYTKKEAIREAGRKLSLFLQDYETKGVVILKNNVRIDSDKNECTAKGLITIKERVGKIQELTQ